MPLQPSIYISGIRIDEPVIALTDLVVAFVCFYSYYKLNKSNDRGRNLFRLYFLILGLATTWGGIITHAFFYAFDFNQAWRAPGWLTGMAGITFLAFANIEFAKSVIKPGAQSILRYLSIIEIMAAAAATIITLNFQWTSIHSAFVLVGIVAPLSILLWIKKRDEAAWMRLLAILIFIVSGLVFTLKLSPHIWFNHVDVAHLVVSIAIYFFYRSGSVLNQKDNPLVSIP